MATTTGEENVPPSPDPAGWGVNYTPSKDTPNGWAEKVGRRRARIMHGQDPELHPEKFTPQVNLLQFQWPTNEEARLWAEETFGPKTNREKRHKRWRKLGFTPLGNGVWSKSSGNTPVTEEPSSSSSTAYAGPAVPLQLETNTN